MYSGDCGHQYTKGAPGLRGFTTKQMAGWLKAAGHERSSALSRAELCEAVYAYANAGRIRIPTNPTPSPSSPSFTPGGSFGAAPTAIPAGFVEIPSWPPAPVAQPPAVAPWHGGGASSSGLPSPAPLNPFAPAAPSQPFPSMISPPAPSQPFTPPPAYAGIGQSTGGGAIVSAPVASTGFAPSSAPIVPAGFAPSSAPIASAGFAPVGGFSPPPASSPFAGGSQLPPLTPLPSL